MIYGEFLSMALPACCLSCLISHQCPGDYYLKSSLSLCYLRAAILLASQLNIVEYWSDGVLE